MGDRVKGTRDICGRGKDRRGREETDGGRIQCGEEEASDRRTEQGE